MLKIYEKKNLKTAGKDISRIAHTIKTACENSQFPKTLPAIIQEKTENFITKTNSPLAIEIYNSSTKVLKIFAPNLAIGMGIGMAAGGAAIIAEFPIDFAIQYCLNSGLIFSLIMTAAELTQSPKTTHQK